MISLLVAVYVVGAIGVARICLNQAYLYPDWREPNFLVPALASIIGWPILLLFAWARVTWAFFSKGYLG